MADDEPQPATSAASRLIVVSNRVPVPSKAGSPSAGGLAVALDAALKQRGGMWFGWSGKTSTGPVADGCDITDVGQVTFAVMDLPARDVDEYYLGFSNRTLWPICHYRLDLMQTDQQNTEGYFRVNRAFADRLARLIRPGDLVWIHDYHCIPIAAMLREAGLTNRMGFFLHIPWPASDVASALPAYELILRSMTAYDVIGFQTPQDAENFSACLVRERIARTASRGLHESAGRRFQVGAFPIGIDTPAFVKCARQAERNPIVRRTRASLGGTDLIIGVDRLDYSKGIQQRIEAYACFIRSNPSARSRVTYLQITPKSRSEVPEYQRMQQEVAELAGQANGTFGDVDWTPIRYINKPMGQAQLAGLYRMARVGLVTPLRDGMNLVAKEFVAAQSEDDPGVLVLSRFAGAAHELDAALLVNPYDVQATAGAIARAWQMPLEERRERWAALMASLDHSSVHEWCDSFLDALAGEPDAETAPPPLASAETLGVASLPA